MLDTLRHRFNSQSCADLDATIEFDWGEGTCRVGIHNGEATFYECASDAPAPELIIYFRDLQLARRLINGQASPIEAFMAGDFRSNGYLVWVFQTLAAFSKA